ncbi:hypothetical protein HYPSUDRAFT_1021410 [Hypholoma sublateritium FD-334 SS-4]|uniref:Uncharacterized protein n=1 Tax=Hypholoma sublateritium (strain FD-334 SS-4) TaxID=945553 RepID=A0A0D2PAP2_HYPSF|nr:hypothetical protein HYPSUDRAFT_1021410 [Hypholoma sublateritium FD-334 SS-4]
MLENPKTARGRAMANLRPRQRLTRPPAVLAVKVATQFRSALPPVLPISVSASLFPLLAPCLCFSGSLHCARARPHWSLSRWFRMRLYATDN